MIGLSAVATVILFTYQGEPEEGTEVIDKGLTGDVYKKIHDSGDLGQNQGEGGIKKLSPESESLSGGSSTKKAVEKRS